MQCSATLLLMGMLFSGCNEYRLEQAELNQQIASYIEHNQQNLSLVGHNQPMSVDLHIDSIHVALREDHRAKVSLQATLDGSLPVAGNNIKITRQLKPVLMTGIRYQDGKLFLKDPRLKSLGLTGDSFEQQLSNGIINQYGATIESALDNYFTYNPVYRLNKNQTELDWLHLIKKIEVTKEALLLTINNNRETTSVTK